MNIPRFQPHGAQPYDDEHAEDRAAAAKKHENDLDRWSDEAEERKTERCMEI